MRRRRLLLGLGAALPWPAVAQSRRDGLADALLAPTSFFNPSNARIASAFATIAFGGDPGTGAPLRPRLQRFRLPMRIGLIGEAAARYAPWVARHAAHLTQLTGQTVELARSGEANVLLVLSDDAAGFLRANPAAASLRRTFGSPAALDLFLAGLTPETGGMFTPAFPSAGGDEIVGGVVLVRTDRGPATAWAAIVEEVTQLLGLFGDNSGVGWSIFNDQSPYADLTGLDRWLVRLLYQPGVRPGMARREAERAALAAMRLLRPGDVTEGPGQPRLDPGDAAAVEAFLRLAFAGRDVSGAPRTRLARWDAPLRVRVQTDNAATGYAAWVAAQVGHLAFLTRHLLEFAVDGPANMVVAIGADPVGEALTGRLGAIGPGFPAMAQALRAQFAAEPGADCIRVTDFADAAGNPPRAALLAIRTGGTPTRLWSCIVRELAGALGMFGTDDDLDGTVFNGRGPNVDLTPLDQRLLRLLYLSALRPGQTRAEARAAALSAVEISRVVP